MTILDTINVLGIIVVIIFSCWLVMPIETKYDIEHTKHEYPGKRMEVED